MITALKMNIVSIPLGRMFAHRIQAWHPSITFKHLPIYFKAETAGRCADALVTLT